jgi:hypothetical protein
MKKPRVETPGLQLNSYSIRTPEFEVKPANIDGEIFTFLCQLTKRPSVQTPEIIRHVDASLCRKRPLGTQINSMPV